MYILYIIVTISRPLETLDIHTDVAIKRTQIRKIAKNGRGTIDYFLTYTPKRSYIKQELYSTLANIKSKVLKIQQHIVTSLEKRLTRAKNQLVELENYND